MSTPLPYAKRGVRMCNDTNHLTYEGALHLAKEWEKQPDFPFRHADESPSE